jgi:signal transduction histidine kinase
MRPMPQRDETTAWRLSVLEAMLSALAITGPGVVVITVLLRPAPRFDLPLVAVAVCASGVIALKFSRSASFRLRAGVSVGLMLLACLTWIALTGFSLGASSGVVCAIVIAAMLLGRRLALTLLVLSSVALLAFGAAIHAGWSHPRLSDSDPRVFANWARMGLSFCLLTGAIVLAVEYVVRHVEKKYVELSAAYDELAELHRKLETAKEEERRFIARELHDDLGQSLTVLKLGLKSNKATPFADPLRIIDGLILKVRELSRALRPALLDEVGIAPALGAFLEEQSSISGIKMELDRRGFDGRLPGDLEIACFRLVQEAVTNALRHSEAKHLTVRLEQNGAALRLRIHDDGRGFSGLETLVHAALEGHLGVIGMRERVRSLGGTFRIESQPGQGTTIEADLPLTPPETLISSKRIFDIIP